MCPETKSFFVVFSFLGASPKKFAGKSSTKNETIENNQERQKARERTKIYLPCETLTISTKKLSLIYSLSPEKRRIKGGKWFRKHLYFKKTAEQKEKSFSLLQINNFIIVIIFCGENYLVKRYIFCLPVLIC